VIVRLTQVENNILRLNNMGNLDNEKFAYIMDVMFKIRTGRIELTQASVNNITMPTHENDDGIVLIDWFIKYAYRPPAAVQTYTFVKRDENGEVCAIVDDLSELAYSELDGVDSFDPEDTDDDDEPYIAGERMVDLWADAIQLCTIDHEVSRAQYARDMEEFERTWVENRDGPYTDPQLIFTPPNSFDDDDL